MIGVFLSTFLLLSLSLQVNAVKVNKTIIDVLKSDSSLTTFLGLLQQNVPQLVTLLENAGNVTLFAPSNKALNGTAPAEMTADVADYHVIDGAKITSSKLTSLQFVQSHSNETLKITKSSKGVSIVFGVPGDVKTTAKVTSADHLASNGVIHVIDTLLVPPKKVSVVATNANLTELVKVLNQVNLTNTVDALKKSTVFAPVNSALNSAADLTTYGLSTTLQYHVVESVAYTTELTDGQTLSTLSTDKLTVTMLDGETFVNGVKVIIPNVLTSTGVVHVVEKVLLVPDSTSRTLVQNLQLDPSMTSLSTMLQDSAYKSVLDLLESETKYTLFAPNNDALKRLKEESVDEKKAILQYHVVPAELNIKPTDNVSIVPTFLTNASYVNLGPNKSQVLEIDPEKNKVVINKISKIDTFDVKGSGNHAAFIVDHVVPIPLDSMDTFGREKLKTLKDAVAFSELTKQVTTTPGITIFAPNDEGFELYFKSLDNVANVSSMNKTNLANVLSTHVVTGASYSTELKDGQNITGQNGEKFTVSIENGIIKLNESTVLVANIQTKNGVVHILDSVIGGPVPGKSKKSGLSGGAIAAIVVGVLVVLGGGVYCYQRSEEEDAYEYTEA